MTGERVKKFADRKSGLRRVLESLNKAETAKPAPKPESMPKGAAKPAAAPATADAAPAVEQPATTAANAPRTGSKRERLLAELRKLAGLTLEQMGSMFGWKPNDCRYALRLLRTKNGVDVAKGDDGTYRAQ